MPGRPGLATARASPRTRRASTRSARSTSSTRPWACCSPNRFPTRSQLPDRGCNTTCSISAASYRFPATPPSRSTGHPASRKPSSASTPTCRRSGIHPAWRHARRRALAHVARTVCRRAERSLVHLGASTTVRDPVRKYVNRLSDLLFRAHACSTVTRAAPTFSGGRTASRLACWLRSTCRSDPAKQLERNARLMELLARTRAQGSAGFRRALTA